jgi:hypothetical protein
MDLEAIGWVGMDWIQAMTQYQALAFDGTGPLSYRKGVYWATVSQMLRTSALNDRNCFSACLLLFFPLLVLNL